ncbi:transmembrane protein 25 isoform X2 [Protopterus annectens]|uniref:transmembrane protein 25 isoform X2 n=1 Tax=Protopterus annectens TaxID=7888 RepID=UPI001CFB5A0D|nr:transmembrane protein 25 isoform X2 [Protopterus annectens]
MLLSGHGMILYVLFMFSMDSIIQPVCGEPPPKINGKVHSVATVEENVPKDFTCIADKWKTAPILTWYLNGKKQEVNDTTVMASSGEMFNQSSSSFVVALQKADKELNCSVIDPESGMMKNATVIFNVQFKPEIVKMNGHYRESDDPGLFLVLFILVRANPPANITWVDKDGKLMVNTSNFLIVDTKSYPWLTNHTVHVQLTSTASNYSFTAGNDVGIINSSISFPVSERESLKKLELKEGIIIKEADKDFLQSWIEVPVLGIIIGGLLATLIILLLSVVTFCTIYRRRKTARGERQEEALQPLSDFKNMKSDHFRLPRENMSLPSNLQLNDLNRITKEVDARMKCQPVGSSEEESFSGQDNANPLSNKGFVRFPMVGYIYKVSSMSSDEIWL